MLYIVYNYYSNFNMLKFQIENWNRYIVPVTIVIVDDCSPVAAEPAMKDLKINHILYRMSTPAFFGAAEARNVGVMATVSNNISEWIFISDMDIVLTADSAEKIINTPLDKIKYYKFRRINSKGETIKTHMNTILMDSSVYWKTNGYDVDYVGTYGGDSEFLDRVRATGIKEGFFNDITVTMFDEKDIHDANCPFDKAKYGKMFRNLYAEKSKKNMLRSINPIRRKYDIICKQGII